MAFDFDSRQTRARVTQNARQTVEAIEFDQAIDRVRKGFLQIGSTSLFAHLRGLPVLNGYAVTYRDG